MSDDEGIGLLDPDAPPRPKPPKQEEQEDPNMPKSTGLQLICSEAKRELTGGKDSRFTVLIRNHNTKAEKVSIRANIIRTAALKEDAPDWPVTLEVDGAEHNITEDMQDDVETTIPKSGDNHFKITVHVPRGVKYGDKVEAMATVTSTKDMLLSESITLTTIAKQAILAIKTSIGQEKNVADAIASRAKAKDVGVFSVLCPENLRGYIIVEAMNLDRLNEIVRGVKRARGIVEGEMGFDEIQHYLTPKPVVAGIAEGDIVELISGPFKGEKARVQSIDEPKEEITVELFEAMVPIPVTVRGDSVRVLEKEGNT